MRKNRGPLRLLSVALVAALAGLSVASSLTVESVVSSQERRLLRDRTTEAAFTMSSLFGQAETTLPLLAATTDPRPGSTERFDEASASVSRGFGAIGAVVVNEADVQPLGTAISDVSEDRADLARRALASEGMVTGILDEPGNRVLSFAVAASDGRVLFQDIPTALFEAFDLGAEGPFSELEGIVYASDSEDPAMRLLATTKEPTLTGDVYRHEFTIGADSWLVVTRAKEPLVGSFAANVHWVLLLAGLLATVLIGALVETLARRRMYAMALVEERTGELHTAMAELEVAEKGNRLAREDAEAANRAKDEFISRMSHELRTPLNAVLGFAQLLELDDLSEEQADSVNQIVKGGRHLLGLINEILDIARISSGSLSLSPEPVAVDELIAETLGLLAPVAAGRNITLAHTPNADELYLEADRQRLKQILLNLAANAVKYNVENGSVQVTSHHADALVRITVADTGKGIPQTDIDKVFVPFERLGAERTGVEGAGIGLALSLSLAEAMGGTIVVESAVGSGSRFTLVLPRAENPLSTAPSSDAAGTVSAADAARTRHKVLYIEDNLSNVRLVERIVSLRKDVDVIPAMQGQLGLDLAREHRPDLILLDLHLPDINGYDVLRQLRRDPATASIPICIVSADATPRQMERLLQEGANSYVTKPIDVQELLRVLSDVLDAPAAV